MRKWKLNGELECGIGYETMEELFGPQGQAADVWESKKEPLVMGDKVPKKLTVEICSSQYGRTPNFKLVIEDPMNNANFLYRQLKRFFNENKFTEEMVKAFANETYVPRVGESFLHEDLKDCIMDGLSVMDGSTATHLHVMLHWTYPEKMEIKCMDPSHPREQFITDATGIVESFTKTLLQRAQNVVSQIPFNYVGMTLAETSLIIEYRGETHFVQLIVLTCMYLVHIYSAPDHKYRQELDPRTPQETIDLVVSYLSKKE